MAWLHFANRNLLKQVDLMNKANKLRQA